LGHLEVFLEVWVWEQQVELGMLISTFGYDDTLIVEQYLELLGEVQAMEFINDELVQLVQEIQF
jgi:hypothetical protein